MNMRRNRGSVGSLPYVGGHRIIVKDVDGRRAYTEWHWGIAPELVTEHNDPRRDLKGRDVLPRLFVECGRLRELQFLAPDTGELGTFHPVNPAKCHLTFDPEHPCGRLHIILDAKSEAKSIAQLVRGNPYKARKLEDLARLVGGRHADGAYPDLIVKPVGLLTSFIYSTEKRGDGKSHYVHRAGEESGIRPCLAVDEHGRIWVAGGNYTSPTPGVTD
jgi:hypothetical protein